MFTKTPTRSRFSSSRPSASGKKNSNNSATVMRPPSAVPRSSTSFLNTSKILSTSALIGNQSYLDESTGASIEGLGASLPVLITEVLALADRNCRITVCVDGEEWAWLVCGRKLFVWRYQSRGKNKAFPKATQCKELMLPASDLSHTAHLVAVISNPHDKQLTACICVSPEGVVRFWPSISHEGSFVEISAELKGEECAALIYQPSYGCIISTTTSTLFQILVSRGPNPIFCRMLAAPQSTLARVSRRMSSFIFGSVTAQSTGAAFHQILPCPQNESSDMTSHQSFFVLSGCYLQKWIIYQGEGEKLLYQFEIEKKMKEHVSNELWHSDVAHLPELQFWLLDIQSIRGAVCVLGAAVNSAFSDDLYYILATVGSSEGECPEDLISCTYVRYETTYSEDKESILLGHKLLIPDVSGTVAFLYNRSQCLKVSLADLRQPAESIDVLSTGGKILGAGSTDKQALFFSVRHGFVLVRSSPDINVSLMDDSAMEQNIPESAVSTTIGDSQEEKLTHLKTAILLNFRGKKAETIAIVNELFPPGLAPEHNSPLDVTICRLSTDMMDDLPAADPRWAETTPSHDAAVTTNSLIILHQLQDKLKAHQHFLSFLCETNLWNRLSSVTYCSAPTSTRRLICEHAEKISSMIALRMMHHDHAELVDNTIKTVLELRRSSHPGNGLTQQDVFYRFIFKLEDFFKILIEREEDIIGTDLPTDETSAIVANVNELVINMLHDALVYRRENAERYQDNVNVEYVPWISRQGVDGLRTLLANQYNITVESIKSGPARRGILIKQLSDLVDIQLDGYQQQMMSLESNTKHYSELVRRFELERGSMIEPFIEFGEVERATALAEKYLDFRILASLCEGLQNQERLKHYMVVFAEQGFTDFLLRWYMEEKKRGKVLALPIHESNILEEFFDADENRFMRWLHEIDTKDFTKAHQTLKTLALNEQNCLAKKKSLLSLSKLCALASKDSSELEHEIEAVDLQHDVIAHQESMPECVYENLALDPNNMNVFSVRDLIQLYTGSCNSSANELDYKKALDLLALMEPSPDTDKLRISIWCSAIKRNDWGATMVDDPLEMNSETVFFKTMELAYAEGLNLSEYLPDVNELLSCEDLGELRSDKQFQFLIQAGYEHVRNVIA